MLRKGIQTGFYLGMGLVFLTLIGLPSDDSEQLAGLAVPIFLLLTFYLGWRTARKIPLNDYRTWISTTLIQGFTAGVVLLSFLAVINHWHAKNIDVQRQMLDKMNTYPIHVLSGIPDEELFPNPDPNPITGEYDEDVPQRTDPMRLSFKEKYAIVSLFGLHIGGLIGLAALLVNASFWGGAAYNLYHRVDWQTIRQRTNEQMNTTRVGNALPVIGHWFLLLLPFFIFLMFWATVSHHTAENEVFQAIGYEEPIYIFNINRQLGLTSQSLIDGTSIQLALGFLIIITSLLALKRVRREPSSLNYAVRIALTAGVLIFIILLALWRIDAHNVRFILPSEDSTINQALSMLAVLVMGVAALVYVSYANQRPESFETTFVVVIALATILITPLFMNQYQTAVMGRVTRSIMFGIGLNIVVGYAGLLDLGYVAFYAIGAYAFAFIALENDRHKLSLDHLNLVGWGLVIAIVVAPVIALLGARLRQNRMERTAGISKGSTLLISLGIVVVSVVVTFLLRFVLAEAGVFDSVYAFSSFLVAIPVSMLVAAFAGVLLGIPVLRLRGDYLAIVTLGFGEIIGLFLKNLDNVTGGPSGAIGVPKAVPSGTPTDISNLSMLYLAIVGAVIVILVAFRLRDSRLGRSWLAMRSDEDIAQAMGINLVNTKLLAFSIGASFAGLAGMLFASQQNAIFPDDFTLEISINVLALVIIGGMGSIPGVVVGAIALIGLPELLRPIADYRIMAFGLLLIFTMVALPNGLMPSPTPALEDEARQLAKEEQQS